MKPNERRRKKEKMSANGRGGRYEEEENVSMKAKKDSIGEMK